ncbi:MAG: hypothetical protein FD177_314 [Desulfovibrionaceae bacterium]|nr:MAG: hypothetical protein FD177_314 [Desulfovibrionaceae bacterium]
MDMSKDTARETGLHISPFQRAHARMGVWISIAFSVCCLAYFTGLTKIAPAYLACMAGAFMLSLAPGFSLFSLFSLYQHHTYPKFTIFLVSISMGMTFNFLVNVAAFIARPGLQTTLDTYMLVVLALYAFILTRWRRQGLLRAPDLAALKSREFLICTGLFLVFSLVLYLRYPAVLFSEELLVVRKITDNMTIAHNNISISVGETATYFFVPLYMFIAMAGKIAGIDAYAAIPGLWPFTALVSILCLVKVSHLLTGRWATGLALGAMAFVYSVFLQSVRADLFVIFAPYPDRYAFSSALLVPLAVFHFLVHMEHKKINLPTFIGLIYLIVEMTFIHARETIFTLVIIFSVCGVLALDYKANRQHMLRILWLIALVAMCLAAYKVVNLIIQPFLKEFVAGHRQAMLAALKTLWATKGFLGIFGDLDEYSNWGYGRFLSIYWGEGGYFYLPVAIMILPLYVFCTDRISMLFIPFAISLFGLYSIWGGIRLILGIAVGVPFVFDCYSILGILLTLVFADILRVAVLGLLQIKNLPAKLAVSLGTIILFFQFSSFLLHEFKWFLRWVRMYDMVFYLATFVSVVIQQHRIIRKLPLPIADALRRDDAKFKKSLPQTLLVCAAVMFAMGSPLSGNKNAYPSPYFRAPLPIDETGTISTIISSYPINADITPHSMTVIDFIRSAIPPGGNWLGTDTLIPLLASNQFSPVVVVKGNFHGGYEMNHPFITRWMPGHDPNNPTSLFDLLAVLSPRSFGKLLADHSIGWMFIDRKSHQRFVELTGDATTNGLLSLVYSDLDVLIYKVCLPSLDETAQ